MKLRHISFISAAVIFLLSLSSVSAFGQRTAEPGSFDPATATAHGDSASDKKGEPQSTEPLAGVSGAAREAARDSVGNAVVTHAGKVIMPESSVDRADEVGAFAHTHHLIFAMPGTGPSGVSDNSVVKDLKAFASPTVTYTVAENPGSLACVYQVGPLYPGCTPAGGPGRYPVGGGGAIAIVDAFHNPDAASDLALFSAFWGLPVANFTQIYCQPYPVLVTPTTHHQR